MNLPMRALFAVMLLSGSLVAQVPCPDSSVNCSSVPRLVRFTGSLVDSAGRPRTGVVGVIFSVYSQATGGVSLWHETQNVALDSQGHYAVLLGVTATEGLPIDIFNTPGPRWVGVWPQVDGEQENARVPLTSVPYAFKAVDAETLEGLPASAFLRVPTSPQTLNGTSQSAPISSLGVAGPLAASAKPGTAMTEVPVDTSGGVVNALPKFDSASSIVPSQISDANGMVGMQDLANIIFADQFPNGVPDAINACPAAGCVIDAYSPNVNLNLGTIDPGSKSVTLYLGPYTYNVTQITLRSSLKIIGMGARATALQSTNGNNPVIVNVQSVNSAAQHVLLSGFQLIGSAGNTSEDGILLDSSQNFNSGMWYSEFRDLNIGGFAGVGLHIKGTNANFAGMTQFSEFDRVIVWRTKGGGNALRIEGAAYNLHFNDCEFEGPGIGDGTNIFVGGRPGNSWAMPIDINFLGLTSEGAATAVQIDGGWAINFDHPHHEWVWGVYLVTGDLGVGTAGLTISGAGFQDVGSNNGNGYLLNIATSSASGIRFLHNHIMNPVDMAVRAQNGANVIYEDNVFFGNTTLPATQGITRVLTSAPTINISGAHLVALSASTTPITTIQATLGAGETASFYTPNGPVVFGSGGNINLMGIDTITVNGSITFAVTDVGSAPSWVPVSQWNASGSTAPGFHLSSSPSSIIVTPGGNSAARLTLTPLGGFSGNVSFGCSGPSADMACSVSPALVAVDGSAPIEATFVVDAPLSGITGTSANVRSFRLFLALLSGGSVFWLILVSTVSRPYVKSKRMAGLVVLLFLMYGVTACGSPARGGQGVLQQGRYNFVVTAAAGSYTQSVNVVVLLGWN